MGDYFNFFQVLFMSMDKYLQGLFVLANDPAPEVRKLVSSFCNVCALSSKARTIVPPMGLQANDDISYICHKMNS